MPVISDDQRKAFRTQGFVVVPGVLTDDQIAAGRALVTRELDQQPPPPGHVGIHFTWPRFEDGGHALLDFYRETGVGGLAAQLVRTDLGLDEPDFAQVATTTPPWPHRPGGPHVDGLNPPAPDGTPYTFSLLAGIWLTDHEELDRGNLYVWPETHLRFGEYLREHGGADAMIHRDGWNEGPYPKVDLGERTQVSGPAGSVLFAHYLLAHNIGGHSGTSDDERRETLYYRLSAAGHRERWRDVVTDPLLEFAE
ncbi:phytanoyl-CoA dioxygenase PhyH [Kribbella amoyensis]|uniref:Phytanoyl-CoA dioxygenase PhyH n=1 Tax=Kribbella amoyensis TaxID=996641 RepID=A0A561BX06_9ACTN|nr:phytanoyl-CoA dioxygenase family protein [Kribbella amoyensis]TWD83420.1 phytanoyl-CoA dioxygenase PhyH [Kribbella amoyensis]